MREERRDMSTWPPALVISRACWADAVPVNRVRAVLPVVMVARLPPLPSANDSRPLLAMAAEPASLPSRKLIVPLLVMAATLAELVLLKKTKALLTRLATPDMSALTTLSTLGPFTVTAPPTSARRGPPATPSASVPALIVVPPVKLLVPLRVSVPLPCLISPPVPEIALASVVSLPSPAVSVPLPSVFAPPPPDSAPTVWLLPFRANVPLLTISAPVAASDPPAARRRVPSDTGVPPG